MTNTIEATSLTKRFAKIQALDGLDLVAEPGQVVAVLGPNGAGKTTFVRAVATMLRPDGGSLHVAGHDVGREPEAVRRVIGLAGQYAAVEPAMTGRENLEMVARLFGQSSRSARANSASVLEQLGLTDAADRLARTYSGGMRRKLDLGASLVGKPRLLLLDEPTTGLDPPQQGRAVGRDPRFGPPRDRRAADEQAFANHQPMTYMVDAVRALALGTDARAVLGHSASFYVTRSLLWAAGLVVAFAPLAVARYRRG